MIRLVSQAAAEFAEMLKGLGVEAGYHDACKPHGPEVGSKQVLLGDNIYTREMTPQNRGVENGNPALQHPSFGTLKFDKLPRILRCLTFSAKTTPQPGCVWPGVRPLTLELRACKL